VFDPSEIEELGRVTIPLQPNASAETVASARKLALSEP